MQNGNSLLLNSLHISSLGWDNYLHFTDEYTEVQRTGTIWPKSHSKRTVELLSHPHELESKATTLAEPTTCTGGHYINSVTSPKTSKIPVYPWGAFSIAEKKWGVRVIECYCPMLCPHISSHERTNEWKTQHLLQYLGRGRWHLGKTCVTLACVILR